MSWPPANDVMRKRIGVAAGDATRDADIKVGTDVALALVEEYLDRGLLVKNESERFFHCNQSLLLRRWPIETSGFIFLSNQSKMSWIIGRSPFDPSLSIIAGGSPANLSAMFPNLSSMTPQQIQSVLNANGVEGKYVDWERGIVYAQGIKATVPVEVRYTGGFQNLPPALEWALMLAFDAVWSSTPNLGASSGGGASIIQGTGEVKKVSLVGIGSVDFDVGATAAGGSSRSASGGSSPWSILPEVVTSVLDRYRRESVVGVG